MESIDVEKMEEKEGDGMAHVVLKGIEKSYGDVRAVTNFNMETKDHEFVVMIGPSGCGKSTMLRIIAGLEEMTSGSILIDGKAIDELEPKDRDIAMVFQDYALYPHMNVFDNMAFGLMLRRVPKAERKKRVGEVAEMLGITHLLKRKPSALSGGQRQRVALGRAMVREPKVFLMDEPLSNLDAALRAQMRIEIVKLHRRFGTTFIYVTHDQTEAMTMADKIVVMNEGHIQQIATPQELYDAPCNLFVSRFIGSPPMNHLRGTVERNDGEVFISYGEGGFIPPAPVAKDLSDQGYIGKEVMLGIRPEDIVVVEMGVDHHIETMREQYGEVEEVENMGNEQYLHLSYQDKRLTIRTRLAHLPKMGDRMAWKVDARKMHYFDLETSARIKMKERERK